MTGVRAVGHGLADLRAHPGRAVLSGFSLCIGVLAVVAIFTIGAVTAEVFVAAEEQQNGRLVTVRGQVQGRIADETALRAALAAAEPVTATGGAAALVVSPVSATGLAHPTHVESGMPLSRQPLTLVAGDLGGVRRLPLLSGRWFERSSDVPVEIMVNHAGAQQWGPVGTELAVLATLQRPPVRAAVVGVIADGENEPNVYVSLPALLHAGQGSALADGGVEVLLHHPSASVEVLRQTAERMATAAGATLPEPVRRTDTVGHRLAELRAQQRAFLAVAVIALAIAALGMLNIGLASVGERARELVIRRAVGATRVDILAQMLISAVMVGILAVGVSVGAALAGVEWWVPRQVPPASAIEPPGLPWEAVQWGIAAAVATTLAGSVLPAVVAARLDVANALRD